MRANKICIAISKDEHARFKVELLGLTDGKIVANASDLEETGLSWGSVMRTLERMLRIIPLRVSRGQIEFVTREKSDGADETVGRQ